ncbi:cupredoxin domain-containing protein [Ramlibacter sp. G-1-2-2]|uniref:Cupredoxin domain-containing protein n=1 Tax=Ramlibacter agri TaxID=2728837 RepID=A0A848H3R0_9BURK|nr:cupredoxin domain-containing protein [Ramlibacter agri]NML43840.1 cupredoxin domain-containing protein [Ramlibacter agri]
MKPIRRTLTLALAATVFCGWAAAAEPEFAIAIKDHRFQPAELKVPANVRLKFVVENQDSSPEEFESKDMGVEKVIPGGKRASIYIRPLKPGRYMFFGEFNEKTAQGVVIAE